MKSFFTFVAGMLVGIILFVGAIGGAAYAVSTSVTLGQLQNSFNFTLLPSDNVLINKTLADIISMAIKDFQSPNTLTLNKLKANYGLPIPDKISGIDISSVFDYPILEIPNHLNEIVEDVQVQNITTLLGLTQADIDKYPILADNMQSNVGSVMQNIKALFTPENLTLQSIKDNLGLNLGGETPIKALDSVANLQISKFADALKTLNLGEIIGIDLDTFIKSGDNRVYALVNRYELIASTEYASIKENAKTYISDVTSGGVPVYKELRFIDKKQAEADANPSAPHTPIYKVDNSSNSSAFDVAANEKKFYRFIAYEPYDASKTEHQGKPLYVKSAINFFSAVTYEKDVAGVKTPYTVYEPKMTDFYPLANLYTSSTLTSTIQQGIQNNSIILTDGKVNVSSVYINTAAPTAPPVAASPVVYGYSEKSELANASTKLTEGLSGYLKVKSGKAESTIQQISELSLNGLSTSADFLLSMKLGDILPIAPGNVLYNFKDAKVSELSSLVDTLSLKDVVTNQILYGAYIENENGNFVYQEVSATYLPYNSTLHTGLDRYKFVYSANATGDYVGIDSNLDGVTEYYLYNTTDTRFQGKQRYDRTAQLDAYGDYIKKTTGYYTVFDPSSMSATTTRYNYYGGYYLASQAQIDDVSLIKYYFDDLNQTFKQYTSGAYSALYLKADSVTSPDSKILQRIASVNLSDIGNFFNSLRLGDIIDLDLDNYQFVQQGFLTPLDINVQYYYFDPVQEMYKKAIIDEAFKADNPNVKLYKIVSTGTSHTLIKKLTNVKITNIGVAFENIMNEMYFSDILEVSTNNEVQSSSSGLHWLVSADNAAYSSSSENYAFVYNKANGTYFRSGVYYFPVKDSDLIKEGTTITYSYAPISNAIIAAQKISELNCYYKRAENNFEYNPALVAYLASQNDFTNIYFRQTGAGDKSGIKYKSASTDNKLCVLSGGKLYPYDSTNPAHSDLPKYVRCTNGYYPAAQSQMDDISVNKFYYDCSTATFTSSTSADSLKNGTNIQGFVKFTADTAGDYYFIKINDCFAATGDDTFKYVDGDKIYSKKATETIYRQSTSGNFVYIQGGYVVYDAENPAHTSLQRFEKIEGFLATQNQVAWNNGSESTPNYIDYLSTERVAITKAKSIALLRNLMSSNKPITGLSSIMDDLTLSQFVDIEVDTLLYSLKDTKLKDLSSTMQTLFVNMSMKDLVNTLNINTMKPEVMSVVEKVSLIDFFGSLKLTSNGELVCDMRQLLGA